MTGILSLPTEILFEVLSHLSLSNERLYATNGELEEGSAIPSSPSPSQPSSPSPSHSSQSPAETVCGNILQDDSIEWNAQASYRTLSALARTCRTIHPIAKRLLYEHYRAEFEFPIAGYLRRLAIEPRLSSYIKHISISYERQEEGEKRPLVEIKNNLDLLGALNEHYHRMEDVAQLETTVLVLQARNVETFRINAWHSSQADQETLPIWLCPVIEAMAVGHSPSAPLKSLGYDKLHTMEINMQQVYHEDMAYLFLLPNLRRLRLEDLMSEDFDASQDMPWPIAAGVSGLSTLELPSTRAPGSLISRFITSCKALEHLECCRCDFVRDGKTWCQAIVSALEYQALSLKTLSLDPGPIREGSRVEGFDKLHALQSLRTPFHVLMGRPKGVRQQQPGTDAWRIYPEDWAGFRRMRDVLPPKLHTLKLGLDPDMIAVELPETYEELLSTALPLYSDKSSSLREFDLHFVMRHYSENLPINLWEVSSRYHRTGVTFQYRIYYSPTHEGQLYIESEGTYNCTLRKWKVCGSNLAVIHVHTTRFTPLSSA
jgi:hypothetical protein